MAKLGFGQYKHTPLTQIPDDYINWVLRTFDESEKGYQMCIIESQRREAERDFEFDSVIKWDKTITLR